MQIIVKLIVKIFENTDERHKVEIIRIKKRKRLPKKYPPFNSSCLTKKY